ncbi:hypothetical protein [Fibrella forsythiae]|uniref:Uncharacterized protein n=1 Tax=Fibrella forsythiae TaxID=2817061 RepID=A0ABS3JVX9_9BACT|nr:hypothetical protein [Fibrella forsythiae]MBO0953072.1 hypothetical protein [Fibrella forsythiae]
MLRSIAALEMAPGEEPLRVPGLKVDHMAPETFFIDRQKQAFPLQLS